MALEIKTMLDSVPGVRADWREDWVDTTTRADWRVDWDATADAPPVNTVAPAITDTNAGTPVVGEGLTVSTGTWTGDPAPTLTYVWKRAGVAIPGATGTGYTLVLADAAQAITVTVTGTNHSGAASVTTAAVTVDAVAVPVNTVAPVITDDGTPVAGEVVTVNEGTWTGTPTPTYAYQWRNAGVALVGNGATTNSYTLQATDVGDLITCTVTGTNVAGTASVTTAAITPA